MKRTYSFVIALAALAVVVFTLAPRPVAPGADAEAHRRRRNGGFAEESKTDRLEAAIGREGASGSQPQDNRSEQVSSPEEPDGSRVGPEGVARIERRDFVHPLIRVEEHWRTDPATGERYLAGAETVADHIIVALKEGMARDDLVPLVENAGGFIRRKLGNKELYLVAFPDVDADTVPSMIETFSAFSGVVEYAEADNIYRLDATVPNDPSYSSQWALPKISAPQAWDYTTGSADVVVGVIDSGVFYTHNDLAANRWENPGETGLDTNGVNKATNGIDDDGNGYIDDVYGWDTINGDNDPLDDHSHGSHVAGIIGAVGNNSIGIAGVCWSVKIMALKVFTSGGTSTESAITEGINYATMMRGMGINVRITNNSYGTTSFPGQSFRNAISAAQTDGIMFVCSAGNDNKNIDSTPYYPAALTNDNIIAVAATTQTDAKSDSNYGAVNVDLGAPGDAIYSTVLNNNYGNKSGTSMAAPHVAGAAALVWSWRPEGKYEQVRKAILDGVDPVSSMQGKTVTGGRLNLLGALQNYKDRGTVIRIAEADGDWDTPGIRYAFTAGKRPPIPF